MTDKPTVKITSSKPEPLTVLGHINEACDQVGIALMEYNIPSLRSAHRLLEKVLESLALDNNIYRVVK
jgi:dihydrodipicolinate synthase/N-acetylneuraminate lyase